MTNKYMLFIANWKMFGVLNSLNSINRVIDFLKIFKNKKYSKIVYCPPYTLILPLSKKLKNTKIDVGAQNCDQNENFGPHTGSVNALMLKNAGAKYVIIGHSENRQDGENDKLINKKIKSALKAGLKVIFCIGETLKEKKRKKTKMILNKQISVGLKNIINKKNIIISYEPVWAIGTGIIPKNKELFEIINFLRKKVKKLKIIYGGSVNPKNVKKLCNIKNIDGFLIGGASQNSKKFIDIIKKTYN